METPDTVELPKHESKEEDESRLQRCAKCSQTLPCDCQHFKIISQSMPCVGRGLYISGVAGVTNPDILDRQKITHVLNMARELEHTRFPDSVSVRHSPLRDCEEENLLRWLPELVEHIHGVIEGGGRIVVNCVAGVSRSASVCLAYKVCHEGLSLQEAWKEVHAARSVVAPNPGFWKALLCWEEKVRGENSVVMKPYICGMIPELETYEEFTRMRVRVGWMQELLTMWTFHLLLFILQLISVVWR